MTADGTWVTIVDFGVATLTRLFDNEQDLRDSEPVLKGMNPPEGLGTRGEPQIFEIVVEARM